uniref:Adenylate kinase isoenzyme 6 homolog n=1 Tax=Rhabditophanes sp. KR3021 TaxID=114890 RepID=A0AC35UEJ3_9BILA
MTQPKQRAKLNILITGTPGVGKSTLATKLADILKFKVLNIGEIVKENGLYSKFDETFQSYILNEDQVLDFIEEEMNSKDGGIIVDHHGCDFFPERYFNMVVVLRCSNEKLYERLSSRGYGEKKVSENIECEIFGTIAEEARESYKEHRVFEFENETEAQMADNLEKIQILIERWEEE